MGDSTGRLYDLKITPGKGQGWKFLTPPLYLTERADSVAKNDEAQSIKYEHQLSVTQSAELIGELQIDELQRESQLYVTPSAELMDNRTKNQQNIKPEVIGTYDGDYNYIQTNDQYISIYPIQPYTTSPTSSKPIQSQSLDSNPQVYIREYFRSKNQSDSIPVPLLTPETLATNETQIDVKYYKIPEQPSHPQSSQNDSLTPNDIRVRICSGKNKSSETLAQVSLFEFDLIYGKPSQANEYQQDTTYFISKISEEPEPTLPEINKNGQLEEMNMDDELHSGINNYLGINNKISTMENENDLWTANTGKFGVNNPNSQMNNQHQTPYNSTFTGHTNTNQSTGHSQTYPQHSTHTFPNQGNQNMGQNLSMPKSNFDQPNQTYTSHAPSSGAASKEDMREMLGIFSEQIMVKVETVIGNSLGEVNSKLVQQDANLSNLRDQLLQLKQEVHQGFTASKQEVETARQESRQAVEIAKQAKDTRGGFRGRNNLSVLHVSGWRIENDGNPYLPKRSHDLPEEFFEVFAKIEKVDAQRCNLYAKEGFTFYQLSWTMARNWGRFLNYCPNLDIRSLAERNLNKTMADKPVFADMRPWAEVKKGRIILEAEDF